MIFDTHFCPLTLLVETLATGIFVVLSAIARIRTESVMSVAIATFLIVLLLARGTMYYITPSFQGTLGGYWAMDFLIIVPGLLAGLQFNVYSERTSNACIGATILILLVVPGFQVAYSTWGPGNAMRYVNLANVRVPTEGQSVPPSNPSKMVQVSRKVAIFKGQTALTSTSQNLGSQFKINSEDSSREAMYRGLPGSYGHSRN